jgi:hypothetical protein
VPTIDPMTAPAIAPPEMQLHELLDCRVKICDRGSLDVSDSGATNTIK